MIVRTFVATFALLFATTSYAGIQSLSGAVQQPASIPSSVRENATENNAAALIFPEQQGVVLGAPLAVDASTSGVFDFADKLTPASVPSGTRVNSYYVHADTNNNDTLMGTIVFDEPILGVILTTSGLQGSHPVVGLSSVLYPLTGSADASQAKLELKVDEERVELDLTARSVTFLLVRDVFFTSSIYDGFRVVTSASVPEPTTVGLAVTGLAGLVAMRRRTRFIR